MLPKQPSSEQIRKAWTYMTLAQEKMAAIIEDCCRDVLCRVDTEDTDRFALYSWPQQWGSTACGFGGIGGQAITVRQTVFIRDDYEDEIFIYHNGQFAYRLLPNTDWETIRKCMSENRFPGKTDATKTFGEDNVRFQ